MGGEKDKIDTGTVQAALNSINVIIFNLYVIFTRWGLMMMTVCKLHTSITASITQDPVLTPCKLSQVSQPTCFLKWVGRTNP